MGPTANLPPEADEPGSGPAGVLVVQNGRLSGTRRELGAVTVIGRAPVCDVALALDGVHALHCAVVHARAERSEQHHPGGQRRAAPPRRRLSIPA